MQKYKQSLINVFKNFGIENALSYCLPFCEEDNICSITCSFIDKTRDTVQLLAAVDSVDFPRSDIPNVDHEKITAYPNIPKDLKRLTPFYVNNFNFIPTQENMRLIGYENFHSFIALPRIFESGNNIFITMFSRVSDIFSEEKLKYYLEFFEPLFQAIDESILTQKEKQKKLIQSRLSTSRSLLNICPELEPILQKVDAVAKETLSVLVTGETGVGKELVADALHESSAFSQGPLIKVNCASIPISLADSLFFGHERGSFTNAYTAQKGYFEQAHTGTLFLDEVGELPLEIQAKLLRVLDRQIVQKLGSATSIPIQVRIISATNRNLLQMVKEGTFRQDLWYRLAQYVIQIPPLRERKKDILQLTSHYLDKHKKEEEKIIFSSIRQKEKDKLLSYDWPGNVRELEYVVFRSLLQMRITHYQRTLKFILDEEDANASTETPILDINTENLSLDYITDMHIQEVLNLTKNIIDGPNGAATLLKVHPQTLYRKLKNRKVLQ